VTIPILRNLAPGRGPGSCRGSNVELFHENWRDYLHDLAESFPSAAVLAAPADSGNPAATDFDEASALVFEVRIDPKHREITFHTEPDEDGAPFPVVPLTIRRRVDQLETASSPEFSMLWVSGQGRVPADRVPVEGDGGPARTCCVRRNGAIAGVAVSAEDHRVVFLYFPGQEAGPAGPGRTPGAPSGPA
jgi:hypothetical protein